eukprot:m.358037 g.358037  ORF g.358037 m.358037 type:complete len:60 (+) comp16617_c0_seq15:2974-3153(+)
MRVLPVWWADNYLLLRRGESRAVSAEFQAIGVGDLHDLRVVVDGFNVARVECPIRVEQT